MSSELASGKLRLDQPVEGVGRLTIANIEKRGALDREMLDALAGAVRGLDARCLVITGEGSAFSSGYDLGDFEGEEQFAADAEQLLADPFYKAMEAVERYRYPILAAINGHAIGGGLELALTCDLRIAARGARMRMPPAKIGLIYSHTGLRKFIDVCGPAHTSELVLAGREVDADRGAEIGLVNHVVAPDELESRALSLAAEIASGAPLALAGNKMIIRALRSVASKLPEDMERQLVALRESCFRSDDFREGVRAFAEKRPPQWKAR